MSSGNQETIFVTGATGTVGRCTVTELRRAGMCVKAGVHTMSKAEKIKSLGCEISECKAEDASCLDKCMKGVDRCFIIPPSKQNRTDQVKHFANACKRNGVRQILLLSMPQCENKSIEFQRQFREMEEHIEQLGVPYCIIQCIFFMQNFLSFTPLLKEGKMPLPIRDGSFAPIDVNDIARAARAILLASIEENRNKRFVLTGPECLSGADIAKNFSDVFGKTIKFVDQKPQEAKQKMMSGGMQEWQAKGMLELYELYARNQCNFTSPAYEQLTQRKGTTLRDFLIAHRAFFTGI